MISHLKTSSTPAIQALKSNPSNVDLEVIKISSLKNCGSLLCDAIKSGQINTDNLFINVFGLNVNFLYVIEQVKNNKICNYERGIGYIYSQDNALFLKRLHSFLIGDNISKLLPNQNGTPYPFKFDDDSVTTLIYSSIPPTYLECLAPQHCVITSSESCLPQSVAFETNSLLVRFDNNIENVSFNDINGIFTGNWNSTIVGSFQNVTKIDIVAIQVRTNHQLKDNCD